MTVGEALVDAGPVQPRIVEVESWHKFETKSTLKRAVSGALFLSLPLSVSAYLLLVVLDAFRGKLVSKLQ